MVQGDAPPLNKIGQMSSIPSVIGKPGWKQPGHGDKVPISYLTEGLWLMSWKSEGGGQTLLSSLSELLSESLPFSALDAESRSLAMRQSASRFRGAESLGWSSEVVVPEAPQRSWHPGELPLPVEVPGFSDKLVAASVMMAASRLGTPKAWRRVAFSAIASRLAWIATRIWTFYSWAHTSFSFWRKRSFLFQKKEKNMREQSH